jgi:hypothetical protein
MSRNVFPSNSNWFRCSADTATCCIFWSNINNFWTHFLERNNQCSWIIISTPPTLMLPLDWISLTVIRLFPKMSSSMQWMFTSHPAVGWMWACSRLKPSLCLSENLLYYHRHLYGTRSLPYTVHLTYEEFLLVSLSLSLGIWWYSTVLLKEWQGMMPSCTSSNAQKRAYGHLPGSECSVTTNCPLKIFIFLVPTSSGK